MRKANQIDKRFLAFLLAVVMLVTSLPIHIFAEDIVGKVSILHDGSPVNEVTLVEDSKLTLTTETQNIEGDLTYQWEILADERSDTWIAIGDKKKSSIVVTYALLYSCINEKDVAQLRVVASNGTDEITSSPVKINIQYIVDLDDFENDGFSPRMVSEIPEALTLDEGSNGVARFNTKSRTMLLAEADPAQYVTVTVRFLNKDSHEEIRKADTRTYVAGNAVSYTLTYPTVPGYLPETIEKGGLTTAVTGTEYTVSFTADEMNTDQVINVYYAPQQVTYKVYHYKQEIYNDLYESEPFLVEDWTGFVDDIIPDVHLTAEGSVRPDGTSRSIEGFHHTYYEKVQIAADGSTVVEVFYDRLYYTVLFNMEPGSYGQDHLYVRYETQIAANRPSRTGWGFSKWILDKYNDVVATEAQQTMYNISTEECVTRKITVLANMVYHADWSKDRSQYTIVYWRENANDGLYSVWKSDVIGDTEDEPIYSGDTAVWDGSIPTDSESEFFTFNHTKTHEGNNLNQIVEGDRSTIVNVYFSRRIYTVTFKASTPATGCKLPEHSHTDGTCNFNPMYCTHVHTAECYEECDKEIHMHSSACDLNCPKPVHVHAADCCDTHTHTQADCYPEAQDLDTGLLEFAEAAVSAEVGTGCSLIDDYILQVGNQAQEQKDKALAEMTANPPQNLRDGYIYSYSGEFEVSNRSVKYDINLIYVDETWYFYAGSTNNVSATIHADGTIIEPDEANCDEPYHDHTSGCTYGVKCALEEHVHIGECYSCGKPVHTAHTDACSCAHEHDATCYGGECMKPEHSHSDDGATTEENYVTVHKLQAKYGQDITALLPYYTELSQIDLEKNASGANFTGWKYDSTGWSEEGEKFRPVKNVTMVSELCYSEGINAYAQYDANAAYMHILYHMFESFDKELGAIDLDASGNGRKQRGVVWYDSDPSHMQIVMSNSADSFGDNGKKDVEGMEYLSSESASASFDIEGYSSQTIDIYYYNRLTGKKLKLTNNSETLLTVGGLKYGQPISELRDGLTDQNGDTIDVDAPAYPTNLEPGAYVFAGWYSTPYINENTKINWETATIPNVNEYELFALWAPVERTIHIYLTLEMNEDELLDTRTLPHGSVTIQPDFPEREGYTFSGWFYQDPTTHEEKAFFFDFPVKADMDIYAKWTSDIIVQYRVEYVVKKVVDGVETVIQIAEPYINSGLAGQNRTVRAKEGAQLSEGYQQGYFPYAASHTMQLQDLGEGVFNVYQFEYIHAEKVKYTVKYTDSATGSPLRDDEVFETDQTAVTKVFEEIEGYTCTEYSKHLILSLDESTNIIEFTYIKNEAEIEYAPYHIVHMLQNVNGQYVEYNKPGDDGNRTGVVGQTYGVTSDDIITNLGGYVYQPAKTTISADGTTVYAESAVLPSAGMEIVLYYDRTLVDYTVRYVILGTDTQIADSKTVIGTNENGNIYGKTVTETALDLAAYGYQLASDATRSFELTANSANNIITFSYQEMESEYLYTQIGSWGSSTLSISGERRTYNSDTPLEGAYPIIDPHYRFLGWFALEGENYVQITEENADQYNVVLNGTTLIPQKKTYNIGGEQKDLYTGGEFFAMFEPNESRMLLSVNVSGSDSFDSDQQFIFRIVGTSDNTMGINLTVSVTANSQQIIVDQLPVGTYSISEISGNWTWRYNEATATDQDNFEVGVEDAEISFTATSVTDKWLNGESYASYGYSPYIISN